MVDRPKRHHFIPQSYLGAWTDDSGQVAMRRRDSKNVVTPHTKNVGIEGGLYGRGEDAARIEAFYGQIETEWPRLRKLLCRREEIGRDDRSLIAIFMALLISRAPDHLGHLLFIERLTDYAGSPEPTRNQVADYFETRHLGFTPQDAEIQAAWDLVVGFNNMHGDDPRITLQDAIAMSISAAIDEIAPRLGAHRWEVQECRKRWLVTTDRPITKWTPPHRDDQIRGIGLVDAVEIRFPLGPAHLLVLVKTGTELSHERVEPRRFLDVNLEAARRCDKAVIARSNRRDYLASLNLADRGPTLRFNTGPGYRTMADGTKEEFGEVLHMYTPRY